MFGNNNNNFINEIYVMSHSIYFPHQSYRPISGGYSLIYFNYFLTFINLAIGKET